VRIGSSGGTPVPNREIEAKSSGSGPVITYRLSPEELERVRRGERLETRKEEATMSTATAPKAPDKMEVLRRLAAGWKIARIEKELGLKKGALQYWLGKWGLKGVKGEQAQQLLDKMLIDQSAEHKAEPAAEPEPAGSQTGAEIAQALKAHELIERLKKELAEKTARVNELEAANVRAVALAGQTAEKHLAEIEQLKKTVAQLEEENKYWMGQTEGLGHEADRLREERDVLLQTIEKAVDTEPAQPDHDPVNHPAHYTAGKVECIDAIESATEGLTGGLAYNTGAAIKYLWRWSRKNGAEDLRKARWYVDRLIAEVETQCFGS